MGPWPPYHLYHEQAGDLMSVKIKNILQRENINLRLLHTSWPRAQHQLEEQVVDLSISWVKNTQREESFAFSLPIGQSRSVFFVKDSKFDEIASLESFKEVKVGLVKGYAIDERLETFLSSREVLCDFAKNDKQNLMRLLGNRVDIILIDEQVARYYLEHDMLERKYEVHQLAPFSWTQDLHLMVSKKQPSWSETIDRVNKAIAGFEETSLHSQAL